jgi:TRAP-type C4-dicarboxylate transport system substrate-binding protein
MSRRGRTSTCISKVKAETVDALKGIKIRVADKNSQEMWTTVGMSAC